MSMSLACKLIARAAGRGRVVPGEIVTCRVDLAMFHDSSDLAHGYLGDGPACLLHDTGAFMSQHHRLRCWQVAIAHHHIGVTHAGGDHAHQDFRLARIFEVQCFDRQWCARCAADGGFDLHNG
jgi:hypothetical protein